MDTPKDCLKHLSHPELCNANITVWLYLTKKKKLLVDNVKMLFLC